MSDAIDDFRALKQLRKWERKAFGVPCSQCVRSRPRAQPTILLPGGRCRQHTIPYVDPRPELTPAEWKAGIELQEALGA